MGSPFKHGNLRVYQAAVEFVTVGDRLLEPLNRSVAACNHLARAMEGIPLHIARANSSWSAKERITYLGHANGSVLECAACFDVLVAKESLRRDQATSGKALLRGICGMLIAMQKTAGNCVREDGDSEYTTDGDAFFSHERLDVYRTALQFVKWVNDRTFKPERNGEMPSRLDKSSTAIVLNIAEGNGRFTPADHARFLGIAHSAVVQSGATLDLAVARHQLHDANIEDGLRLLGRIDAMLAAMVRRLKHS